MKLKQYISIFILIIFSVPVSLSQSIFETKIIELQEGLRERIVNNVERDAYGFFYVTTNNFIQRWDGRQFVDIDISSLPSRSELGNSAIELLKNDNLVLLTQNAQQPLYEIDIQKRILIPITNQWNETSRLIHSAGELYLIDDTTDSTTISNLDEGYQPALIATLPDSIHITSLSALPERLIIQSSTQEIYSYLYSSKLLITHKEKGNLISSESQNTVLADSVNIYHFSNNRWNIADSIKLVNYRFTYGDYDQKGRIAVGHTDSERHIKSLKLIDQEGNVIPYDFATVPNKRICDIYADDYLDKAMLATYNGLYYHKMENGEIKRYQQDTNKKKGNFGNIINAITHDSDSNVYYASEGNGLYKYDTKSDSVKTIIAGKSSKYFRGNIKLLYDSLTNTLWSIGHNNKNESDLYSYNTDTKKFNKYPLDFLANDFLFLDGDHFLLSGRVNQKQKDGKYTYIPRLVKYNFKNHTQEENTLLQNTKHLKPRNLFPYKDYMFIASTTGLIVTDRSMSTILKEINVDSTNDNIKLEANWIVFVKPYNDQLMVGTNGDGFFMLDPDTLEPNNKFNIENGLSDNIAVSMEVDSFGNAWVTSFMGINIIDTHYQIVKTIYEHDGLSDREFNSTANTSLDGLMYFGTADGLSVIDPIAYLGKSPSQGQYINAIDVIYQDSSVFRFNNDSKIINIKDDATSIEINVQCPDYYTNALEKPMNNIELSGMSNYTIRDNSFSMPIEATGIFTAQLNNKINGKSKTLTINVGKKIPWTTLIILGVTTLLAYLISRFIIKKNKEREEEKTNYNKKISELRLNALKSQMNPHFIFNSLGAIQYFIQTQDTGKADEYLSKFAKLMRLILESSKKDYITIKDEMDLMELYVDLEYVRFEGLFDYNVKVDHNVIDDQLLPPMIVQPLVENAVNHGLYNLKDRKGHLEILTQRIKEDKIRIIIRDNGVGRSYQSNSAKPKHKSRGMEILKERIGIINDAKDMHVDLKITDLFEGTQPSGTEVSVDIEYLT